MTTQHQPTREEEAYKRLLDKEWDTISEAARIIVSEAETAAYAEYLVHNVCFLPYEYEEAMQKMLLAAAATTDRDRELLMELVRCSIAACASIDLFDEDTIVKYRAYRSDLHRYYLMVYTMVGDILYEQFTREHIAELEPVDESDIPF